MMLPVDAFTDFISQNNLFGPGANILAAVSGGMDSVLMVHFLKASGYQFSIAHCNFHLRGDESAGDQLFCEALAKQLSVPFYSSSFNTLEHAKAGKISIQMAARQLRYNWFEALRQENSYDVIALAHHQNDAIETILLNLTRGTGIAGLHGILPKNGKLVRPMLCFNREEIEAVVKENNMNFREDSSNASAKYARNKLRLEVIPRLKELNPALEKTFEANLRHFKDLEQLLNLQVEQLKTYIFLFKGDEMHLPIERIKLLKPEQLLLYGLLQEYGFNETTVADIISSLDKHSGKTFESAGFTLTLDRTALILIPKNIQKANAVSIGEGIKEIAYTGYRLHILHDDSPLIIKNNPLSVSADSGQLIYPLTLRPWRHGDTFQPLGMKGHKKVSDLLIAEKIPLAQKANIPVLVNGNGEIIWVGGYRLDERYKVTGATKKVTIFELFKVL